jgi:hypothetical protein
LIIDLHNTTANTGVALLMAPDDERLGFREMGPGDALIHSLAPCQAQGF